MNIFLLTLTSIENGVAWFENEELDFSIDIPADFEQIDRHFSLDNTCQTVWCDDSGESGYYLVSKNNNMQLMVFFDVVDDHNFVIDSFQIFPISQLH